MWQIGYCLNCPFQFVGAEFIEQQRKNNRCRKGQDKFQKADYNSIFQNSGELHTCEHLMKILESDPVASQDAVTDFIILKGDQNTAHWKIVKQYQRRKAGSAFRKHGILRPINRLFTGNNLNHQLYLSTSECLKIIRG